MDTSGMHLRGGDSYYTEAMEKQQRLRGMTQAEKLIARANDVSIFDVLEDWFDLSLPREGTSFKHRCPFYYEHADGGLDKGWRTYPATNSSMCFPMHGFLTPVRLIQIKYSERASRAAERILNNYGLLKPKHWRERYEEILLEQERQKEQQSVVGNPQHAAAALSTALSTHPLYTSRRFDEDFMDCMDVMLERLNDVSKTGTREDLRTWFTQAQKIMAAVMERKDSK